MNKVSLDIPVNWKQVLDRVQQVEPSAIIAGGAVRDLHNRRVIKDLDIVIPHWADVHLLAKKVGYFGSIDITSVDSAFQDRNFSFSCKFSTPLFDVPTIELIGARGSESPVDKVLDNDFGICQIWYDGTEVKCSDKYLTDKANETFTLCRCRSRFEWEAVQKHYKRLVAKYDWPIVISPIFMLEIMNNFDLGMGID